jgi:putative spermidine/putrescine transport system substrate-binding protein
MSFTRRKLLQGAAALGLGSALPPAHARESLTVLEFGGPYVDASQKLGEKWGKADFTWDRHSGGGAAILAKAKATWPNTLWDVMANWSPTFPAMIREGWLETITPADVPNLADIPERFITKDDNGNIKNVPRSVNGGFFAVRTDTCPIEIKTLDDLLNPKLKGQISWPVPTVYSNMATVTLALARGGNERNMEPGWKFLEEIAKSGNIGRVYSAGVQNYNSLTTGETSVTYTGTDTLSTVGDRIPMKALTKVHPSLKTSLYVEAWILMANSKNKKLAMDFINFASSPENCEFHNRATGGVPANSKSKVAPKAAPIQFTPQELDRFVYLPDWSYMSVQQPEWVKRFERDITPNI